MNMSQQLLFKGTSAKLEVEVMPDEKDSSVGLFLFTLTMTADENRFTVVMNNDLNSCLDALEAFAGLKRLPAPSNGSYLGTLSMRSGQGDTDRPKKTDKAALIVTGEGERYFSLGLDLPTYQCAGEPQELLRTTYMRFVSRLLCMGMVTVAAVNGHVIAGGLGVALACDYVVMRSDRGYAQMIEIILGTSIPLGLQEVVRRRFKGRIQLERDIFVLGRRFSGNEALEVGLVDALKLGAGNVLRHAKEYVMEHAMRFSLFPVMELIKIKLNDSALKALIEKEDLDHFKYFALINKV